VGRIGRRGEGWWLEMIEFLNKNHSLIKKSQQYQPVEPGLARVGTRFRVYNGTNGIITYIIRVYRYNYVVSQSPDELAMIVVPVLVPFT